MTGPRYITVPRDRLEAADHVPGWAGLEAMAGLEALILEEQRDHDIEADAAITHDLEVDLALERAGR